MEKKDYWKKGQYVILTSFVIICLLVSTLSFTGMDTVRSVSVERIEEGTAEAGDGGSLRSTSSWTHTSKSDFQSCDREDVKITGSGTAGSVQIEKRTIYNIGTLDNPDSNNPSWEMGKTIKSSDEQYQMDRGGTVNQISIQVGTNASMFKVKVLRKSSEVQNEFTCEHTTTSLDPAPGETTDFNAPGDFAPFDVKAGDWIGIYTYNGTLDANASFDSGGYAPGYDIYHGNIKDINDGGEPRVMKNHNTFDFIPMTIDVSTYRDQGNITKSPTKDTEEINEYMYEWGAISWSSEEPAGTNITVETRSSDDGSTWSLWEEATNGETIPSPARRYVEYRVSFTTDRGDNTPVLNDIRLTWYWDDDSPDIQSSPLGWQQDGPYRVNATISDDPLESGVDQTSPYIRYSTDGGNTWTTSDMQSTGGNYFEGTIPNQDGGTEILYEIHASDTAGNEAVFPESSDDRFNFSVDKTPPVTYSDIQGDDGDAGWYTSDVTITLSSTDESDAPDSGSAGLYNITYKVDDEDWQEYSPGEEIPVDGDGHHQISYYATDNVGNVETVEEETIKIDSQAPTTTHEIMGAQGRAGWYIEPVEVALYANDDNQGKKTSNVSTRRYQLDGGISEDYNQRIPIDDDGEHTLKYWSIDNAGNVENQNEKTIDIDTTAPSLTAEVSGTLGSEEKWYTSDVTVNFTTSDATSGVLETEYKLDNGSWQTGDSLEVTTGGVHTINYTCMDQAGNEVQKSMEVSLDLEGPSISRVKASDTAWRQDMEITATISDPNSDIKNVYVRYNAGDGFKSKQMEGGGGTYRATIPGKAIGFGGEVEYQVIAQDWSGNQRTSNQRSTEVSINWLFIIPIPIAVGVILFLVYAKKRREKEKEILPVKESKIDRISSKREEKLDKLDQSREQRKASGQEGKMALTDRLKQTISGGGAGVGGENSCDICGSTMNPDAAVQCPCGNIYHDDCLREEGNCLNCGRDYAEISDTYSPPKERQEPREEREYSSQPPSSQTGGGGSGAPSQAQQAQQEPERPRSQQPEQQQPEQPPQQQPEERPEPQQPPQGEGTPPAPEEQKRDTERERVIESLREPVSKTVKEQEAQETSESSTPPPPSQGDEIFEEKISDEDLDKDIERMLDTEEEEEEGIVYECPNCGESVSSDAKECPNCGAIFKE